MIPTTPAEWERLLSVATDEERAEIDALLAADMEAVIWRAQVGQQMAALNSQAFITGYGGAAGGGKTDLIAGLASTEHSRSVIFRKEKTQTEGVIQRLAEILGSTDGYSSQKSAWRCNGRLIEFGGLDNPDDHQKWQGRAHDLKAYDEVTEMREAQVRFTMGWTRSADTKQRARVVMTFNPPTTTEGRWVIKFFAPWLDDKHPNPAKPGELRWFTTIKGQDFEVEDERRFVLFRGAPVYDFDPSEFTPEKIITPKSRTFIPSRVTDNYFYLKTGYIDVLQSLPEPLRSQMLDGNFMAGVEDDPWQVIPTAWVDAAMKRWERRDTKGVMDSMGVDIARGGKDQQVISRRHGNWFDELVTHPGIEVKTGPVAFANTLAVRRDLAPVHVDVVGWGASAFDFMIQNHVQAIAINGANKGVGRAKQGNLAFYNKRAEMIWRMREALDPEGFDPVALPPDNELKADLCAPTWEPTTRGILVESKEDIAKRIGRSTDKGDAVCMANIVTPRSLFYGDEDDTPRGRSGSTGY